MLHEEFDRIFEETVEKSRSVLASKSKEYSTEDKLHNFKVSAATRGVSNRDALAGMMVKHTTSIYDLLRAEECADLELWDEKIGDHINYLILLRAMVIEELGRKKADAMFDLILSDLKDAEEPEEFAVNTIDISSGASYTRYEYYKDDVCIAVHTTPNGVAFYPGSETMGTSDRMEAHFVVNGKVVKILKTNLITHQQTAKFPNESVDPTIPTVVNVPDQVIPNEFHTKYVCQVCGSERINTTHNGTLYDRITCLKCSDKEVRIYMKPIIENERSGVDKMYTDPIKKDADGT